MSKYTEKLVEKIVSLIEEDTYSISEICSILKLSRKTFYEWKDTKPEFEKAIEKATDRRDDKLLLIARKSLKRKLEGYTLSETRTTYVPDKDNPEKLVLKSQVVRQKEYAPDTHAIKLLLAGDNNRHERAKESSHPALMITVNDPKSVDYLNLLQQTLSTQIPKEKREISDESKPLSEVPVIEPQPEKKSRYVTIKSVTDQMVPPGYRYRK